MLACCYMRNKNGWTKRTHRKDGCEKVEELWPDNKRVKWNTALRLPWKFKVYMCLCLCWSSQTDHANVSSQGLDVFWYPIGCVRQTLAVFFPATFSVYVHYVHYCCGYLQTKIHKLECKIPIKARRIILVICEGGAKQTCIEYISWRWIEYTVVDFQLLISSQCDNSKWTNPKEKKESDWWPFE